MNSSFSTLFSTASYRSNSLKALFISLSCLIVSCGGGGGGTGASAGSSDLSDNPITGRWISPCDSSSGALSFVSEIEYFADGTFTRTVAGYFDLACSVAGFDATTTGTVTVSNAFELPDRGLVRNLNQTTNAYSIIPRSAESTAFFNSQATCGISNWEVNVDYDISSCPNRPGDDASRRPTPYADFSIYLVERGQLFYGNEVSFTAENRPTSLATRPAFVSATGAVGDEFPDNLKGLWVLPESNEFLELSDQGLIRFYGQAEEGCFGFNFLTLFSTGGDSYIDPFRIFTYTISESDGNLSLTAGNNPQVFTYMPAAISANQLELCT
ncbi:MAG: hypothetical protein AB8B79_21550 [Granulosicoccus sp.]